ncbi:Bor/Iss family lipoprotein [Salinibacter ruber]|uniref:Bor/Iss family lipoprotein n=1 Tax=Salinibacter ruber TaxID=146919 RepID=UPI0013C2CBE4|nr:hypothetical protein [Salinibacter ruber]
MKYVLPVLLASCLILTGCYQARMTTSKEPSNTVVEKKWATSFLYGLVPARIDVTQECPNGIASAERKMSFPNMLVSTLTFNIYSPQSVRVTCAADGSMSSASESLTEAGFTLSADATQSEIRYVLNSAALQSSLTQESERVRVTE